MPGSAVVGKRGAPIPAGAAPASQRGRYRPAMGDVTVATALTELEAEQVASLLRAEGIPSYIQGASSTRYVPLQPIEIRVSDDDAARARELVDAGREP